MTAAEFKKLYDFNVQREVEWADMDAFQHVNNTMYFRYFEKVRFDYFETNGFANSVRDKQLGPILASTQCRFKFPLTYPDQILIGTYISDLEADRFLMNYGVYSLGHARMAAQGDGLIVCYDYDKAQKTAIPAAIFKQLQANVKKSGLADRSPQVVEYFIEHALVTNMVGQHEDHFRVYLSTLLGRQAFMQVNKLCIKAVDIGNT